MRNHTHKLVTSALLLALAVVFQSLGQAYPYINQVFVGPVINTVLIITACLCGMWWAAAVGTLTPIIAYLTGILNTSMGPFIPFIILGNAIFVISFGILYKYKQYGKYLGLLLGAFLKFLFLSFSATKLIYVLELGIKPPVAKKLAEMMGTLQLVTALTGGLLALFVVELLKRRRVI